MASNGMGARGEAYSCALSLRKYIDGIELSEQIKSTGIVLPMLVSFYIDL